jgi:hypothetical protein
MDKGLKILDEMIDSIGKKSHILYVSPMTYKKYFRPIIIKKNFCILNNCFITVSHRF